MPDCKNCKYTDEFCASGDCPNNNSHDYKNDLAFKPAMSWEDLCEYAKSKNLDVVNSKEGLCFIRCRGIVFIKNHIIFASGTITDNVSYERMKTIIEALWG